MKVKNSFHALRRMIGTTHHCAAAFASVTPYCNRTTSNLMATALLWCLLVQVEGWSSCSKPIQKVWQEVMSQYKGYE